MNDSHRENPLVLVIFGITGDLAQRKLLPALYQLARAGELPEATRIVGISRREVAKADVFHELEQFVHEAEYDRTVENWLSGHTDMRQMDLLDRAAYETLRQELDALQTEFGPQTARLYYLSIPAQAFTPIVRLLGETGHHLAADDQPAPRLLVEKPFGYDLSSARELIATLSEHFQENQVYRIDHYVAKETVQNILVFRFQNPLFEGVWNNRHVDHITITAHEQLDIEGRANFYEQTGALRDLIQSHLLQLLAITAMDRPARLTSTDIHHEKLRLLQAVTPIAPNAVHDRAIRGQYDGYRSEVANPDSTIETFARLTLEINTANWRGVPITLETGKALSAKRTEISVCFRQPEDSSAERNKLIFRIQPSEGITLRLETKQPGIHNTTAPADMSLDFARSFNSRPAEAYERVIVDAIRGDQTLFASSEEVIRSWEIIENVLQQWSHGDDTLLSYTKGSDGPVDSPAH
jgi:glucose-6-phosphate 1-dehydrogenase